LPAAQVVPGDVLLLQRGNLGRPAAARLGLAHAGRNHLQRTDLQANPTLAKILIGAFALQAGAYGIPPLRRALDRTCRPRRRGNHRNFERLARSSRFGAPANWRSQPCLSCRRKGPERAEEW